MPLKLLNRAYGLYQLSLLRIELNIDFDYGQYNWDHNEPYQKATFVHEYIHYLQDISTTYGLLNFNHVMNTIQGCMNSIANSKEKQVTVPIDLSYIENYEKSKHLIEIREGDCDYLNEYKIINLECKVEEIYKELYGDDIYHIILQLNVNGKDKEYIFGGRCILESMAYLIESHGYESESMRNTAPYNLCEEVTKWIYDKFPTNNKSLLVALCDISLMSINPGVTFYSILKSMDYMEFIPKTIDDVYNFVNKYIKDNTDEIYNEQLSIAMDRIDFMYSKDLKQIKDISMVNEWLKRTLNLARHNRDKNRKFIADIMNYKNEEFELYFFELLHKFGIPLIKNKEGEVFNGITEINPNLNLIFANIPIMLAKIFDIEEDNNVCELLKLCQEYGDDLVDDDCIYAPWKKSTTDILCPFAIIWYHRCLNGKSLIRKK